MVGYCVGLFLFMCYTSGTVLVRHSTRQTPTVGALDSRAYGAKGFTMGQLSTLILAATAKGSAKAAIYAEAFRADSLYFFTANSDQEICAAVTALPVLKAKGEIKGDQFQQLGDAIGAAMKAGRAALPDGAGWIGAKLGAFSKAPKETRAPYLAAHAVACEVFASTLAQSPLWRDATEEEQAAAKEERAAAKAAKEAAKAAEQAEQVAAVRAALIASGELVPADTAHLGKCSAADLLAALLTLVHEGHVIPLDKVAELSAAAEQAAEQAAKQAAKQAAAEPALV